MDQREQKNNRKISKMDSKDKSTKIRVTLPYVRGISEALGWVFRHLGVSTLMKPHLTLKMMLVHLKDKRMPHENSGVVYQVLCKDCKDIYTVETERRYRIEERST